MPEQRIISERNDVRDIRIEIPDFDGDVQKQIAAINRGGWDAAEYGISRDEAIRRVVEASTPEARQAAIEDIRGRAVRRADLDATGGRVRVAVAGDPPWHGLGINVAQAMTSAEAIALAGLDWTVSKRRMYYPISETDAKTQDEVFAIARDDDHSYLGCIGSRYAPIQNAEAFGFLDEVLGEHQVRYESAGSCAGGRRVWMLARLPKQDATIAGSEDELHAYALFTNTHDGSGAAWCHPTNVRVVCSNTLRLAARGQAKGIAVRHAGDLRTGIAAARKALGLVIRSHGDFAATARRMLGFKMNAAELRSWIDEVLDAVLDVKAAHVRMGLDGFLSSLKLPAADVELIRGTYQRRFSRREQMAADILARHEGERCGIGGARGTLWAAFNAVTEHADHAGRSARDAIGSERRFESLISGDADEVKQAALEAALEAMAA